MRRGSIHPTDPNAINEDVPALMWDELPALIETYRATLIAPPASSELFSHDAVRVFGQGVASFPRVRQYVLVSGPSTVPHVPYPVGGGPPARTVHVLTYYSTETAMR